MAKKKFKLEIVLGNDAMQTSMDVSAALKNVVHDLDVRHELSTSRKIIRDINGNTVGHYRVVGR